MHGLTIGLAVNGPLYEDIHIFAIEISAIKHVSWGPEKANLSHLDTRQPLPLSSYVD